MPAKRAAAPAKKAARKSPTKPSPTPKSPANAVDAQLARYRSMRDFTLTAEPSGATPDTPTASPKAQNGAKRPKAENGAKHPKAENGAKHPKAQDSAKHPFVIQKHAASHLHYDFRLAWNGVLKSWACAKGPSLVVQDRRLAVQVEDHPIDYGGFEGIIPPGQYGGGTVMLWDHGTWEPQPGHTDVDAALRDGALKFLLHGARLHGKWTLIRMKDRTPSETSTATPKAGNVAKHNWLLIKEHDDFERPPEAPAITGEAQTSILTGRTMQEIAAQHDHTWNSNRPESPQERVPHVPTLGRGIKPSPPHTTDNGQRTPDTLPPEPQPLFLPPQLAQETQTPPTGPGWLHELKLDGYRLQARKSDQQVQLLTRSGLDWTARMPAIAAEIAKLPARQITLDGEVVVLSETGATNFADLQAAFQEGARNPLTYFAFDLLHLDGHNPRSLPLRDRKALLAPLLAAANPHTLQLSEHLESDGLQIFHKACELHAEGIVSKRAASPYASGRTSSWLKSKCLHQQEFVIGGYTLPGKGKAGGPGIGALLLGFYDDAGALHYAGRTGTGFTQTFSAALRKRLEPMHITKPPFAAIPAEARRGALWVTPTLVAQVRFATWTAGNQLRQAAFLGLREDKSAAEVRRERTAPTPKSEKILKSRSATKAGAPHLASEMRASAKPNASKSILAKKGRVPHASQPHRDAWDVSPSTSPDRVPHSSTVSSSNGGVSAKPRVPKAVRTTNSKTTENEQQTTDNPLPSTIRLTHPQKILDPSTSLTKRQLADFYLAVAPRMLPHIANRPLSLVRCPEGSEKPCFFQKHTSSMLPPGVGSVQVPDKKTGKPEPYITLSTPQALAGLAQMGVLEIHPWGSTNSDLEHPNQLTIDLDPDESLPWPTLTAAALDVRARLKSVGLASWVKTTGGKGLHVVIPIQPALAWPQIKDWCRAFVTHMEQSNPALYLTTMSKAARPGKIYLDYLRNERGATAVAPYSPRARAGMGVAVPLAWPELSATQRPLFRVANFADWSHRLKEDVWAALLTSRQTLPT